MSNQDPVSIPEYLSREALASALKDSLDREKKLIQKINELEFTIYSLEETISGKFRG